MSRHQDWEAKLNRFLETVGPFEWGTNDCCMFAVSAVESITGVDHGIKYRGYKTKTGAARRLSTYGGVDGIATLELGEPKNINFAKRGDVVLFDIGNGDSLGVCLGSKIAAVSESGLMFINMSESKKVWSV